MVCILVVVVEGAETVVDGEMEGSVLVEPLERHGEDRVEGG